MNTDKKITDKMVAHSIVETSRVLKRLSALVIFASFFTLSLIVLFQIGDISLQLPIIKKYIWILEILLALWFSSRFAIVNIKKAYFSMYVSYTLGAALIAYCSVMVHFTIHYQPIDWFDLKKLFVWITPILGINALWKLMFILLEYKVRPFFAHKMFFSGIQDLLGIALLWIGSTILDIYVAQGTRFNAHDEKQIAWIFSGVMTIITIGFIGYILFTKYWKYSEYGRTAHKKAMLWNSLMKLGSMTVWFVVRDVYMHITLQWWILAVSSGVLVIILVIFALSRKHSGGGSKVYTFMAASIITTIGLGMFVMGTWWKSNSLDLIPIVLIAYTAIYLLDVIVEPSTTWWITSSFSNVVNAVATYVLLDWIFGNYFGDNLLRLPFSINELVVIPFLVGIASLEIASIISAWGKYNKITRSASAILKLQKPKGEKHE